MFDPRKFNALRDGERGLDVIEVQARAAGAGRQRL